MDMLFPIYNSDIENERREVMKKLKLGIIGYGFMGQWHNNHAGTMVFPYRSCG